MNAMINMIHSYYEYSKFKYKSEINCDNTKKYIYLMSL